VLTLLLILFLTWAALMGLLTAWTLWFQSYIYTEAAPGVAWRGPAAGSALMAVLLLWVLFDYRAPGRYRPLWEFSSAEEAKPFPELRVPAPGGKEEVYQLRPGTRGEYRRDGLASGKPLPARPREIIAVDGSEKSVFKPELDDKGNFKERTAVRFGREVKDPLRYLDEKGRVMEEGSLGQLASRFRWGWFLLNCLLNFLLLAVAFVAGWLILQFQWPHALGQAVVLWAALLLFVVPPLLSRAEQVAQERAAARGAG
jgi:hypothetical protein